MAKSANENELKLIREFNAPVELVWDVWTKDEHVMNWWGPRGFSITTESKNVSPGGKWIYTMHGPGGENYPNITTYHEVIKYSRLVYDHGASPTTPPLFRVTAIFNEINGKTQLDMTMTMESPQAANEVKKIIKNANGNSTWDRLGEYLEEKQTKKDIFMINRSFSTNVENLFDMWTNPDHFSKWMGPTGSTIQVIRADINKNGSMFYSMVNAENVTMYGKINYKEIKPHTLLKYSQNFCNKEGQLIKPAFAPTWPNEMLTVVNFYSEGEHESRICLTWEILSDANEIERKTFNHAKDGMTGGWTGSFDKLEAYIEGL